MIQDTFTSLPFLAIDSFKGHYGKHHKGLAVRIKVYFWPSETKVQNIAGYS